jgi:hypothetical protein
MEELKEKIRWLEYNNFPFDGTMVSPPPESDFSSSTLRGAH